MQKYNILYIHSHDTGRYIEPQGYDVKTPHLLKLAREGVLFRRNFCVNPTCSPSRAGLLTGMYPHQNGMTGLAHRGHKLNDYSAHLVQFLKRNGYVTALAGIQHEAEDPAWIGYDRILGNAQEAHVRASEFLRNAPAQPFFLSVGFFETHREFPETGAEEDSRYTAPPAGLPDTPEIRGDMARFRASARILDSKMGAVFQALEDAGLRENTLVICTTDHGIAFPRMKCNLTDDGTGTFLILRGPGGFAGGRVCDQMTTHLDLFPTLCEWAGLAAPDGLQGRSLLPWIRGEELEIHQTIFAQLNYHATYEPVRAVRSSRYKYIKRWHEQRRPVGLNCDAGPSKDCWVQNGWLRERRTEEELYDLLLDPCEKRNLASDPEKQDLLEDLRGKLAAWQRESGDPLLLHGQVCLPEGCITDDTQSEEQI